MVLFSMQRDLNFGFYPEFFKQNFRIFEEITLRYFRTNPGSWIIFTQDNPVKTIMSLTINGISIPRIYSHRFLEIILNHNLSGKPKYYLKYLINKVSYQQKNLRYNLSLNETLILDFSSLYIELHSAVNTVEYGCQFFPWDFWELLYEICQASTSLI